MSKSQKQTASPATATRKRPLNLTVDRKLAEVFGDYCAKNRKAISISAEVEEMMIKTIKNHGHRFGLTLPAHLANA